MEPNKRLWPELRRIAKVSRPSADRLLSLFHTFGVLTAVWAFECFLTERCTERDESNGRRKRPQYWRKKKWQDKVKHLRPDNMAPEAWEGTVQHYTPEMYFRTRNLWCHGTGMPDAVKPKNQPDASEVSTTPDALDPEGDHSRKLDEANYYQDAEGRLWAKRKLWVGCANALKALAGECW